MDLIAPGINKKSQTISGEAQLRHFGQFLATHDRLLRRLTSADDHSYSFHHNIGQPDPLKCRAVRLEVNRHENLDLFQLASTSNTILNKIVCVFAQLCAEVRELRARSEELQLRFLFVDSRLCGENGEDLPANTLIVRISELLKFFGDIQYLVQRCVVVGAEILRQLAAFFGGNLTNTNNPSHQNTAQLQSVFARLADLATILVTFDFTIQRSNVREHWPLFCASIDSLADNSSNSANPFPATKIAGLQSVLGELTTLFDGDLFLVFLNGMQNVRMTLNAKSTNAVSQHFDGYLRVQFFKADKYSHVILNDFTEARDVVRLNVMCVVQHVVFGKSDSVLWAKLFEMNQRHCGVTLLEHFLWQAEVFIEKYVAQSPKSTAARAQAKYVADAGRGRNEFLRSRFNEAKVLEMTQALCGRGVVWMMSMHREAQRRGVVDVNADALTQRCSLIMEGMKLMGESTYLVKLITNLHIQLSTHMTRPTLANVCRLLDNFKCIKNTYKTLVELYVDSQHVVSQHLSYHTLSVIQATIQRKYANHLTISSSSYNERDIDVLSALQLAERSMFGPTTATRLQVTRLALSISDPLGVFSTEHLEILGDRLTKLEALLELEQILERSPDTTFVYWHQTILPIYMKHVMSGKNSGQMSVHSVRFLAAINEPETCPDFDTDINHLLRSTVLARVCSHIENNLRLFIHAYMHDDTKTTPLLAADSAQMTALVHLNPLPLRDHHFVFKNHIEHYLSKTFYNLTAVSLSDGRTYSDMRSYARIKYDLHLVDDQLPSETLEQGLDLLDIMRLMSDFVAKFVYDMNSQVFIQATSGNNFLNTVSVGHIVNSFRTHGVGVMNTAINCGYKMLCQKMPLISKFLYADKVRSALAKCVRHFSENKARQQDRFSFELAKNLVKNAPRLTSGDMMSFTEFLATVTEIGNILGYVRLVRSAGIKYIAKAAVFLPPAARSVPFEMAEKCVDLQLNEVTCDAAWNVKVNVANLSKDFVTKPDYFKSFLQAFTDIIRNPKNDHLRHFYISVPSLTIQFVDALIRSKEYKHKSTDADRLVFTDDGFAMGLAYILIVLEQVDAFNTLDWFTAVRSKYEAELLDLDEKRSALGGSYEDEKLRQTLMLTVRRLRTLLEEFEMLRCNLRCALRFFQ